jgi:hypothetical protein
MRTASIITAAASIAAAAAIGTLALPPISANAADSAIVTIGQLKAQGFDVRVDRVGSAPLSQCDVTDVRNPQERTEFVRVDRFSGRDRVVPIVVARTVTVSLDCSSR